MDPNGGDLILLHDEEKMAQTAVSSKEVNFVEGNVLKLLRSKKVCMFLEDYSWNLHYFVL